MSREWSGDEGVYRENCRHSIDAADDVYRLPYILLASIANFFSLLL